MANCKICGGPVKTANMFHSACWETAAHKIAEEFCDNYCRWPRECPDQDSLEEFHCAECPMARMVNMGV